MYQEKQREEGMKWVELRQFFLHCRICAALSVFYVNFLYLRVGIAIISRHLLNCPRSLEYKCTIVSLPFRFIRKSFFCGPKSASDRIGRESINWKKISRYDRSVRYLIEKKTSAICCSVTLWVNSGKKWRRLAKNLHSKSQSDRQKKKFESELFLSGLLKVSLSNVCRARRITTSREKSGSQVTARVWERERRRYSM